MRRLHAHHKHLQHVRLNPIESYNSMEHMIQVMRTTMKMTIEIMMTIMTTMTTKLMMTIMKVKERTRSDFTRITK
jgi:hypothetical protein